MSCYSEISVCECSIPQTAFLPLINDLKNTETGSLIKETAITNSDSETLQKYLEIFGFETDLRYHPVPSVSITGGCLRCLDKHLFKTIAKYTDGYFELEDDAENQIEIDLANGKAQFAIEYTENEEKGDF